MIETEHRGYTIRYSDNAQEWYCSDLNLSAPQLPALRDKINAMLAKINRMNTTAILVKGGAWGVPAFCEVTITSIASDTDYHKRPQCWISYQVNGKAKREKVTIDALAPVSDEVRAAIETAKAAAEQAKRAEQAKTAALNAIPRLSLKELQASKIAEETNAE